MLQATQFLARGRVPDAHAAVPTGCGYSLPIRRKGDSIYAVVVLQTDERFKDAFRTAEAIYISWVENGRTDPSIGMVKEAGERMIGRKLGVMRETE